MIDQKIINGLKKLQPILRKEAASPDTLANNHHFIDNANRCLATVIGALEGHNKHGVVKGKMPAPAPVAGKTDEEKTDAQP